jgi:hypothetical protein
MEDEDVVGVEIELSVGDDYSYCPFYRPERGYEYCGLKKVYEEYCWGFDERCPLAKAGTVVVKRS